uniref:Leucine-rich repeat protein kinase family protein n=1 Tax=Tanacetum cinerariifolium TaxID=118510 RepID=A0A6L2LEJ5_TANCI|nr:leucine-rich repeat protein kinase family protein [Tanacetum cinerariifolium]
MKTVIPYTAKPEEMQMFHSKEYMEYLSKFALNMLQYRKNHNELKRFHLLNFDCHVFEGLFEVCETRGFIGAAQMLNRQKMNIVINWASGLHYAKKTYASRFCYVDNIVAGILELLTMYKEIDIFPLTTLEPAKHSSKNRVAETLETKPILSITKDVTSSWLIQKVLPAIIARWPQGHMGPIYIQQDNVKPHIGVDDVEFLQEASRDEFDIRIRFQPPNSPDLNVLDLGFFSCNSISSRARGVRKH